jgi:hypothetical protein
MGQHFETAARPRRAHQRHARAGQRAATSSPTRWSTARTIRFLVDTGATLVSIPVAEAQRLGINYLQGTPGYSVLPTAGA